MVRLITTRITFLIVPSLCGSIKCCQVIRAEFLHKFKVILFAIFEDKNSTSALNPSGNGKPFAEAFEVPLLSLDDYIASLNVWKAARRT